MPFEIYDHTQDRWGAAIEYWLRRALNDVLSGKDAIGATGAALTTLRIQAGELPPDESLMLYVVTDSEGIPVGGQCPELGRFPCEREAAEFIGELPDHETGRYNLDGPPDDW